MSGPNMQPVPIRTPEVREIRRALISEINTAAAGVEYAGLETRILAGLATAGPDRQTRPA